MISEKALSEKTAAGKMAFIQLCVGEGPIIMSLRGVKRRSNLPSWTKEIASGLRPRNDTLIGNTVPR